MVSTAASPVQQQPSTQHQYGTRIRSNSIIRPSIRLRQSPDPPHPPRRIKPVPAPKSKLGLVTSPPPQPDFPPFPPPHVMLHSDDANSKIFMAIGRSFMSVDNRAMTIKDLAEMTMKYGLMCQNVSAAGQAITTYLRNHLQRCDVQQDHPLLLRHVLSGTAHDDDLVPALHSRVGGAHCTLSASDNRVTNFRRGTMVWYLSKAAGAPCPFARAGIQLSDYSENGRVGSIPNHGREKKRERDRVRRAEQCGQKRKRLLRACADKGSDSDSLGEEEKRPPKVKLTLRLRPSLVSTPGASTSAASALPSDPTHPSELMDLTVDSDSDDDSMSIDSETSEESSPGASVVLEPYPRRSLSIPSYTPSLDGSYIAPEEQTDHRRSPSVPYSVESASPPPDSEDEDADFHISMTSVRRSSSGYDLDEDEEDDLFYNGFYDVDAETTYESPGPRSPSVQFEDEAVVKQEPIDLDGHLAALDDLEITATGIEVVRIVEMVAAGLDEVGLPKEDLESCDCVRCRESHSRAFLPSDDELDVTKIKEEEVDQVLPLFHGELPPSPQSDYPISPVSASPIQYDFVEGRRQSELMWSDVELLGPDTVKPHDLEDESWLESGSSWDHAESSAEDTVRRSHVPLAVTDPKFPVRTQVRVPPLPPRLDLTATGNQNTVKKEDGIRPPEVATPSLISSLTTLSICTPTSPDAERHDSVSYPSPSVQTNAPEGESRVELTYFNEASVHICACTPAISATQFEGIFVYQMSLGSSVALRRIDSDFVNFSPIARCMGIQSPSVLHAVVVTRGSPAVRGTWVPRAVAQPLVEDHPELALFLSDSLHGRFSSLLPDPYHATSCQPDNEFGPHFQSTVDAERSREALWEPGIDSNWESEDHLFPVHPPFSLASIPTPTSFPEDVTIPETPLSPTEEEMFHVLCAAPDWEASPAVACPVVASAAAVTPSMVPLAVTSPESPVMLTSVPPAPTPLAAVTNCSEDCVVNNEPSTGVVKDSACRDRPLRRSKRVANAIANSRSRTRSNKRGSRSSLS
ncbi:hypothetical protein BKA93DRAFT_814964 [Sparassis latifolia]